MTKDFLHWQRQDFFFQGWWNPQLLHSNFDFREMILQLYTPEESVIYTSLIEVRVRRGITLAPAELQRQNEQWYFTPWMYFCTPLDPLTSDGQSLQVPHVLTGQHFPHNEGHVNFHLSPRSAALMHFFGVWLKIEASLPDGQALREEALHRPVVLWALRMPQQESCMIASRAILLESGTVSI